MSLKNSADKDGKAFSLANRKYIGSKRELADRIPGARLVVVAEAGHQPFQEAPEEYNRLLADFWESLA
jgi:pimeloyl-ACP methyl ester carboxylesterase